MKVKAVTSLPIHRVVSSEAVDQAGLHATCFSSGHGGGVKLRPASHLVAFQPIVNLTW